MKKCTKIVTDAPTVAKLLDDKRHSLVCRQLDLIPEHKAIEGSTVVTLPDGTTQRNNLSEVAGGLPTPMCMLMLDGLGEDLTVDFDVSAADVCPVDAEEQRANTKFKADRRR